MAFVPSALTFDPYGVELTGTLRLATGTGFFYVDLVDDRLTLIRYSTAVATCEPASN